MDGTDLIIAEPTKFSPEYYSHKFKHAAFRYEVLLSLSDSKIVFVNGPFKAGKYNDMKIFSGKLEGKLKLYNELTVADGGYAGDQALRGHELPKFLRGRHKDFRARHETVNRRFKSFGCLQQKFRHDRDLHCVCFHSVACIVQVLLDN